MFTIESKVIGAGKTNEGESIGPTSTQLHFSSLYLSIMFSIFPVSSLDQYYHTSCLLLFTKIFYMKQFIDIFIYWLITHAYILTDSYMEM